METFWKVPGMSQNVKTLLDKCLRVCAIDMWWQLCDLREIPSGTVSAMQ